MSYRYELESDSPLVLFLGIANRPTVIPSTYEQTQVGEEKALEAKDWGGTVTMRRVA